jgi:hypothetical protein
LGAKVAQDIYKSLGFAKLLQRPASYARNRFESEDKEMPIIGNIRTSAATWTPTPRVSLQNQAEQDKVVRQLEKNREQLRDTGEGSLVDCYA